VKAFVLLLVCLLGAPLAFAQNFDFKPPASANDPTVPKVMRDLAERILPVYQENDQDKYLHNLSGLQLVAGNYPAAWQTRIQLRDRRKTADAHRPVGRSAVYDIYAYARSREAEDKGAFTKTYGVAYRAIVSALSGTDAFLLSDYLNAPVAPFRDAVQRAFDQWRPKGSIPQAEAIDLVWTYLQFDAYRSFHPLVAALEEEDDSRRYVTDWDVLIQTPDGANISAVVVRPKDDTKPLPTLLEFTIYVDSHTFAKECAAHGYVGIVAFTRGERRSRGPVTPFKYDGADARVVINWIAKQPWSDGRVGMYGGNYSGFTEWAATTRHLPPALKAIATNSAYAPGVDFPMTGNIVRNAGYRWSGCVANLEGFDEKTCGDEARWRQVDEDWYTSGKPYRELEHAIDGRNIIFHDWLDHPSYDRFWQKFIPYKDQFRHVKIPVLATTGYYANGEVGTLYYFTEHYKYDPHANHTLLIGPYDDGAMQHGASSNLRGYQLDQAALVDLRELRYQWFDYIFKGGEKPAALADRVNFQVMGSNEWQHAPSIEAMGKGNLKFYLDAAPATGGETRRLSTKKMSDTTFVPHVVDLADRSDASLQPPAGIVNRALQLRNAVVFVSEPLKHSQEFSGLFSGKLDFTVNKQDLDLTIGLYELLPGGDYVQLYDPVYELRASYAHDRVTRRLLRAGERQQLTFKSDRLTSRKLEVGSRLVVVLGVNKRPDRQINYGTAGAVNEESVEDGRVPVKIRWYSDSYIELPIRKAMTEKEPPPTAPAAAPAKGVKSPTVASPAKNVTSPSAAPVPTPQDAAPVASPPVKKAKSPAAAKQAEPPPAKDGTPAPPTKRTAPTPAAPNTPPQNDGAAKEPAPPAKDTAPAPTAPNNPNAPPPQSDADKQSSPPPKDAAEGASTPPQPKR
jgi:putative CocE/NonD family hydrolase